MMQRMMQVWRPWEHSTGPQTLDGKAAAKLNVYKGATVAARTGETAARERRGVPVISEGYGANAQELRGC